MKVTLIVKCERVREGIEAMRAHLGADAECLSGSGQQLRMGAWRIETLVLSSEIERVYRWFNEAPSQAPFPEGTLLFFTVSP